MSILLADDEAPLLHFLARGLRAEGHVCTTLTDLHDVVPFARKHSPDIVVLDRLFGSQDSLQIISVIKALPEPPMILMLTALDDVSERVRGLQEGADDYLCKPFDFDEFLARITALQRRAGAVPRDSRSTLEVGTLVLEREERVARVKGAEMSLTKIELELLIYLTENQGKVLSRERILNRVWKTHSDPQTNIVDVYISRLRRKLATDADIAIQTLRGNGYRLALREGPEV